MIRNEEKYQKAREFRKRGFTYSEIAKIVGVSKSTVSNWLGKQSFSKKVRKDNEIKARRDNVKRISLVNKTRSKEREDRYKQAVRAAETEFRHYKHLAKFMGGLMLYAGSGDTNAHGGLRVSDQRPEVHRIFVKFAMDFLGVEKTDIRCWLAVPVGTSEAKAVAEWSKTIRLPHAQFHKSQKLAAAESGTLRKTVGNTIIGNAVLKRKLMRWIELASKELSK